MSSVLDKLAEYANRPKHFGNMPHDENGNLGFVVEDAANYPELRYLYGLINRDRFIAGGCFRDIFTDRQDKIRDIDLWHRSKPDWELTLGQLKFLPDFEEKYETPNAKGYLHKPTNVTVEAIGRSFGSPEDILKEFDFSIAKFALFMDEFGQMKVMYHLMYFDHLVEKKLDIHRDYKIEPDGLFNRMVKYISYGYTPSLSMKMNLFNAIKNTEDVNISDVKKVNIY